MGLTVTDAVASAPFSDRDDPLMTSAALATTNIIPIMIQIATSGFRFILNALFSMAFKQIIFHFPFVF